MRINSVHTIQYTSPNQTGLDETDGVKSTLKEVFKSKKEAVDHINRSLKKNQERKVKQENVKFNIGINVKFGVAQVDLSFGGERTRIYDNEIKELEKAIESGEMTRL